MWTRALFHFTLLLFIVFTKISQSGALPRYFIMHEPHNTNSSTGKNYLMRQIRSSLSRSLMLSWQFYSVDLMLPSYKFSVVFKYINSMSWGCRRRRRAWHTHITHSAKREHACSRGIGFHWDHYKSVAFEFEWNDDVVAVVVVVVVNNVCCYTRSQQHLLCLSNRNSLCVTYVTFTLLSRYAFNI